MSESVNFPIVLQQTGYVAKVQETVGRAPENQQEANLAEAQAEEARRRRSVQQAEETDAQNKVRADGGQEERRQRRRQGKRRRRPGEPDEPQRQVANGDPGGLVDVVV